MSTDTRDLLFVYGTLKCCCNNPFALRLSREGIFVSAGNLPGRLYRLDWYPALVADPAGGPVHGEVWDIDASSPILADLDRYEGHEFRRERLPITTPAGEKECWVYLWTGDTAGLPLIPDGVFED